MRSLAAGSACSLLLALSLGCEPSGAATEADGLAGLKSDIGIVVQLAEKAPSVAQVSWTPPQGTSSWVEFGETADYGKVAPQREGASGEAVLFGMPASTEVHYRVVVDDGVELRASEDRTYTTGEAPEGLDRFTLVEDRGDDFGEYVVLPIILSGATASLYTTVAVLDRQGRPVWWTPLTKDHVRVAKPTLDGQGLLFAWEQGASEHESGVVRVGFDGEEEAFWPSQAPHHDFMERADGSMVVLETAIQEVDGEMLAGDDLVRLGADGSHQIIWSAWDELTPDASQGWDSGDVGDAVDWTHANGFDYDEASNQYLISLYWPQQVLYVDAATGLITGSLGGEAGTEDWRLPMEASFGPQHAPAFTDSGLLLFDNGFLHGATSRVMEISLDDEAGTGKLVWDWRPPPGNGVTLVEGDLQQLDDGSLFTSWGMLGDIAVLGADRQLAWHIRADDVILGRGEVF